MWYIYSSRQGNHYPLELGYRAVDSWEIRHNYELVSRWCQEGCESYGSGGCPPWAPPFAAWQEHYPYAVLLFARFFCRYQPDRYTHSKMLYLRYRFPDIILSRLFSSLGYQVQGSIKEDIVFLNSGHCMGCGQAECNFLRGYNYCLNPVKRTYAIGATGIESAQMLQQIFGIRLQWISESNQEVSSITKLMGLLCKQRKIQNRILDEMIGNLNALSCSSWKIPGPEYQDALSRLL